MINYQRFYYSGLILPSRYETFGIEAMSCGLFVIATKTCAIPEIITSEKYGLLFNASMKRDWKKL